MNGFLKRAANMNVDMSPKRRRHRHRIAMISTHGYVAAEPPLGAADTGGQVVFVLELSKKLAELGYKVDIYTRLFESQPKMDRINDNVAIHRIPCGGNEFIGKEFLYRHIPEWVENALRFIKKNKYNYEFINSHYWDAGLAGQNLSNILKIPHIHTPHSIGIWKKKNMEKDYPDDKDSFENKYNFKERIKYETIIYKECNLVIATTPIQLDLLFKEYDVSKRRMRMIPPGYDDSKFYPVSEASKNSLREKFGFEGKVITSLGRLALNKGYDLLIQAFKIVVEREKNARLVISVGNEKLEDSNNKLLNELYQLRKQLKLEEQVQFLGYISDDDLPDFYRASDVFALSSRYEPFGMTAIEAMACGTPTVITTHGGLYRVTDYGQHVLFADTFDAQDFGISLLKPLRYPSLYSRLSRFGAIHARSHFTWTGIAQQTIGAAHDDLTLTINPFDKEENIYQ